MHEVQSNTLSPSIADISVRVDNAAQPLDDLIGVQRRGDAKKV